MINKLSYTSSFTNLLNHYNVTEEQSVQIPIIRYDDVEKFSVFECF